jgi:hypothetical protein
MDAPLGDGLADVRDRTLFLLGFQERYGGAASWLRSTSRT